MSSGLRLSNSCGLAASTTSTHALPRSPTDASLGTVRTHVLLDQILVSFRNANAFAVEPVVACAVAADHESTIVRFSTNAVQVCVLLFITIFIVVVVVLLFWIAGIGTCGRCWG
jgi:hypothetical protein